ncbi:MAG: regulatory protein RecX [Acidiferrobacterales bacterium]|nr:regulatory protein RecX [Acidiferrobacterales bacterium]
MTVGDGMSDLEKVRLQAVRFLARREYCEQELTRKLTSRGASLESAQQVVDELKGRDMINDARFAQALVRVRMSKGYGPIKIRNELRQKGVSSDLIDSSLDFNREVWLDQIVGILRRKYKEVPPANFTEWAKRARFLQGRGFSTSQIRLTLGDFGEPDQANVSMQ